MTFYFVCIIGTVSVLNMRWKRHFPECDAHDGQALTMEKTVSLFFVWAAGAMAAVAILFAEVVGRLAQKNGIGGNTFCILTLTS